MYKIVYAIFAAAALAVAATSRSTNTGSDQNTPAVNPGSHSVAATATAAAGN